MALNVIKKVTEIKRYPDILFYVSDKEGIPHICRNKGFHFLSIPNWSIMEPVKIIEELGNFKTSQKIEFEREIQFVIESTPEIRQIFDESGYEDTAVELVDGNIVYIYKIKKNPD